MALLTQTAAIEKIRTETKLSESTAIAMVKRIAKDHGVKDGARIKVLEHDIDGAIADVLRPTVARKEKINNVKPFSPRLANRIRRSGVRV